MAVHIPHLHTARKATPDALEPAGQRARITVWHRPKRALRTLLPILMLLGLLLIWELVTRAELLPAFIIPTPASVWERLLDVLADGRLWLHTHTTSTEMMLGLAIGIPLALLLGYFTAHSRTIEALISPLLLALQSTPVVAYAPVLVIWFGTGITSKIVICALIVFFPMWMNTVIAIRQISPFQREVIASMHGTRWDTFRKLEVPAALPVLLSGLKVSATLAVIGAVVGEFVSANAGLGQLIKLARDAYDTPLVAVAVLTLAALARLMYALVGLLERWLLRWQPDARS
jgi:NitT/TauT family transport system permease protein